MNVTEKSVELIYEGSRIRADRRKMICLTDMWRAIGKPKNQDPGQWLRLPTTTVLVRFLESNMGLSHVCKSTSGNKGGTWAIPNLAVVYAEYLSPRFHAWASEVILDRLDVGDIRQRDNQVVAWVRHGKDPNWVQKRLEGILVRNAFTDTLQKHGVTDEGYPFCTNAVYTKLLGGTATSINLSLRR